MRGLKRDFESFAPKLKESHLLQMRGLKRSSANILKKKTESHLLQMRGLKRSSADRVSELVGRIFYRCVDWNRFCWFDGQSGYVASFTDAWIETYITEADFIITTSHLLQMRGLKPCFLDLKIATIGSHLLQMRGLKLDKEKGKEDAKLRRIFYRCVDWNNPSTDAYSVA